MLWSPMPDCVSTDGVHSNVMLLSGDETLGVWSVDQMLGTRPGGVVSYQ